MTTELEMLTQRITALEARVDGLASYLKAAMRYASEDAQSSLTKSRIVLEKMLQTLYTGAKQETRQPMIGEMLSDKAFVATIPRRMLSRINAVRDMSNLGPHGEDVVPSDAYRVMRDLIEVLEWYVETHAPAQVRIEFGDVIETQIAMMKGYPLSYVQSVADSDLEKMLAQDLGITQAGAGESKQEVAFRHSFPQYLDWLRAQSER